MASAARLRSVRNRLLTLHKVLLDAERARYQQVYGPVRSSGEMLRLVLGHQHFAWLRPYSGLIVRIDEWLAGDTQPPEEAEALLGEADRLTAPAGDTAEGPYRALVDGVPAAAVAHASVRQAITEAG